MPGRHVEPRALRRCRRTTGRLSRRTFAGLAAVLAALTPAGAVAAVDITAALRNLQALDVRVTTIGYRLSATSADLCPAGGYLPGFAVHDLSEYAAAARPAAHATFGLGSAPQVLAVAAGSPADRAGLRAGDAILDVEGWQPPPPPGGKSSFDRAEAVMDRIDAAAADGTLTLRIERGGARPIAIALGRGCGARFQAKPSGALNASADGHYVQVTSALAELTRNDDELAAILAHELAHNILGHPARLDAEGARRGLLGAFGRSARLTRATEDEADRLSVGLIVRAGYRPEAAVEFWRRFGRTHGAGIFRAATHGSERERAALIQEEIDRLPR